MKRLFFYFIVLVFSIWLGLKIYADSGQVFIAYQNWTVKTSLWFGLFILFVFILLLHALWFCLDRLSFLPKKLSRKVDLYTRQKSRKLAREGFTYLVSGEFSLAEKKLIKATKGMEGSFIYLLLAAKAAQRNLAFKKRDVLLEKASVNFKDKKSQDAIILYKAQLEYENDRFDSAEAILVEFCKKNPRQDSALKLLKQIYIKLENWNALFLLLPKLKKNKLFKKDEFEKLASAVYLNILKELIREGEGLDVLKRFWKCLPAKNRGDIQLLVTYVNGIKAYGTIDVVEKLLIKSIKEHWDIRLIGCYAQIKNSKKDNQLALVEAALKKHRDNPTLLFYLGMLCGQKKLWGKAQDYLKRSLSIDPEQPKALFELAHVSKQLGLDKEALELYQNGAVLL